MSILLPQQITTLDGTWEFIVGQPVPMGGGGVVTKIALQELQVSGIQERPMWWAIFTTDPVNPAYGLPYASCLVRT